MDQPGKIVTEGGCGVLGVACTVKIEGKFLLRPMIQMRNRGNGKGGGIAAVGLSAQQLGVSERVLRDYYILQIAYLEPRLRRKVEEEFISPYFHVELFERIPSLKDHREVGLKVKPPEVWRYFVKVDEDVLRKFAEENGLSEENVHYVEDEFVFRNSFKLNKKYYASLGEKKAFILSCGKNIVVLKLVGYAEQVIKYYKLEELKAHIWIGHQRYPTKGKVWHPGGAHPFVGVHDALVHNGDFANYYSIAEYLRQRGRYPLFLTDTEVAALYWDLLVRVYRYPLEYAIEAIAPTTERDFSILPEDKKFLYKAIQITHIHGSPDGPWFFIIARNDPIKKRYQLIGITDTSMLRPQVFALQEGNGVKMGIIASERQAIDALLEELAEADDRFHPVADLYWYARGGSYTDGGAFIFTVHEDGTLVCTNKFGKEVRVPKGRSIPRASVVIEEPVRLLGRDVLNAENCFKRVISELKYWSYKELEQVLEYLKEFSLKGDAERGITIELLTLLLDRRYELGGKRRSLISSLIERALYEVLSKVPRIGDFPKGKYCFIDWDSRYKLRPPSSPDQVLVIDVRDFEPEGEEGICGFISEVCEIGWRRIIAYNFKGQRNFGAGLIAKEGIRIDVYGRVGDCLAAFADGPSFYVHGSVQDSVAYCFRSGRIVVYGDAGKAFGYGAKGGIAFILGDLMDRPFINAVGSVKAVINGSCLDYLGESFMAAHGFIILNGIKLDDEGNVVERDAPYQGGNLFSLAAAGAVYIRDPRRIVGEDQLNGAKVTDITYEDWRKILPLLKENERLFGIKVSDLLRVNGELRDPREVYRKIVPVEVRALTKYEGL